MFLSNKILAPYFIVFGIISGFVLVCWNILAKWGMDHYVLLGANSLFLLMCLLVFAIQKNALSKANPNVFIRSIMSGMMIKMFLCVIAVLIYTVASGDAFNKRSVFVSLLLYLVYLAIEVMVMTKLNKQKNG